MDREEIQDKALQATEGKQKEVEANLIPSALYASTVYKLKPRGSNYTAPKKKRKK